MRIGIEAQRLFRKKRFGLDVFALQLIQALQLCETNHEFVIFVKPDENREGFALHNPKFTLVECNAYSYLDWEQLQLPRLCTRHNIDVLHCTANTSPFFIDVPLVLTLHDTIFIDSIEVFTPSIPLYQSWGNLYRNLNVRSMVHKANKVVTVSDFEKKKICSTLGLSPSSVQRIYNGVSPEFFTEPNAQAISECKSAYSLPESYVLFLGNTHPRKNMKKALTAFMDYYNKATGATTKLVLTNITEQEFVQFCRDNSIECNTQAVVLPGYIQQAHLSTILSMAKCLLYPSIREGFGIPVVEAFASGTPVITSTESSLPEVAGDAALLVNPHDVHDISRAIHTILSDRNLYETLAVRGKERSLLFTWESAATQYIEVYNSL